MSTEFSPSDLPLEHEPTDEDRPADPDEDVSTALPDDERPLDPADAAPAPPLDDDRPVRLDDDED
ncbi:hypothetical protein [Microbacterium sp. 10M-3C3]|jgi:hypothetical protein|uniref:hypothetical protein n=1 Tax=Microbacterium sp. 10M-3C3 TaxID=2483401 RepID=UPI000F63ECEE|nr:hypothetical protein [Microbacterium sp. 10M-3C3]